MRAAFANLLIDFLASVLVVPVAFGACLWWRRRGR